MSDKVVIKDIVLIGVRFNPLSLLGLVDFNEFHSRNMQVTHLDITPWMNPVEKPFPVKRIHEDYINYFEIKNKQGLMVRISKFSPKNTLIVFGGWWYVYIKLLDSVLKQQGFKTLLFNLNPITHFDSYSILKLKLRNIFSYKQISLPNYCICEGAYKAELFKAMGYKNIWPFHSRDYERFLALKKSSSKFESKTKEGYILYIDQDFLDHRDFKMFNVKVEGIRAYFKILKEQLNQLSERLNKKVVFALHPSASIEDYKVLFPEFEMQWGDTFSVVPNASLVLGHFSNALDMAVLFDKRIILLDVPSSISKHLHKSCLEFSNRIKGKYININDLNKKEAQGFSSVNQEKYDQYIRNLINTNHPSDETFSENFFRHINERTNFVAEINECVPDE